MKKNIIYIRVSTDEQRDKGHSLEQQEYLCRKLLKNKGIPGTVEVINDGGYSAKNFDRPGIQKAIELIKAGKVSTFAFVELDRLTRNTADTEYFFKLMLEYKVNLECVSGVASMDTPENKLQTIIQSAVAQYEREKISQRTLRGIEGGLRKGLYTLGGITPFGYDRSNKILTIAPNEASIVEEIFRLTIEGLSLVSIKEYIHDNYNIYMIEDRIKKIIFNKKYTGILEYNNKQYLNVVPQIIDLNDFNQAQYMFKNEIGYREQKNIYLFADKIRCKTCGELMRNRSGYKKNKKYTYQWCDMCNRWLNELKICVLLEEELLQIVRKVKKKQKSATNHDYIKIRQLLIKNKKKLERLEDLFLEGLIDKRRYGQQYRKLNKNILKLQLIVELKDIVLDNFFALELPEQRYLIEQNLSENML